MIVALALLLVAPPTAEPPPSGGEATTVNQIGPPREKGGDRVEQVDVRKSTSVAVEQLPDTIDLPRDDSGPEGSLEKLTVEHPRAELYREVATAWEMIRRRGQQPTPELIAREIGPDMLARFLNQFPGSEGIFGADSDQLPIGPPDPPVQPPKPGNRR